MAAHGQGLSQTLSQQQRLAPQMQQSLQVLQAPTLELRQLVQQELSENPVLELEDREISLEEAGLDKDTEPADDFDEEFSELSRLDEEWRDYLAQTRSQSPRREDLEERRRFLLDSLATPVTLQEHLLEQLGTADVAGEERELAEMIIGNLDDAGFLQTPLSELCLSAGIPIDRLEAAKRLVQGFDPVGVAAESLRECLLMQLERMGRRQSLETRIVSGHLDDLARKRYPLIARKLGVTIEQVGRAADFIATLDPRPGAGFADRPSQFINPDVLVERDGDEWIVSLNDEQIPHLRISNHYKDLMASGSAGSDVRSYIRDKIRSGKFLIKSIHQRQQTISNIAREIVARQRDFLEHGPSRLRPMNMSQVADAVGVHETTVSRAISGKSLATPHGVFEMKYFFTTGYRTESGESMSNTSVKKTIAEMVRGESPTSPLSDQRIVEELKQRGIEIARRTVAKYRDELNILPSNLRKGY